MKIIYKNKKIQSVCENYKAAEKQYGSNMAEKIHLRIMQMRSISSVEEMIRSNLGKCHQLKGKRSHQYAVNLEQPFRLVFEKEKENIVVKIIEIVDYH